MKKQWFTATLHDHPTLQLGWCKEPTCCETMRIGDDKTYVRVSHFADPWVPKALGCTQRCLASLPFWKRLREGAELGWREEAAALAAADPMTLLDEEPQPQPATQAQPAKRPRTKAPPRGKDDRLRPAVVTLTDCVRGLSAETIAEAQDKPVHIAYGLTHLRDKLRWHLWILVDDLDLVCRLFCESASNCGIDPPPDDGLRSKDPMFEDKHNRWKWAGPCGYKSRLVPPLRPDEALEDYTRRKEEARVSLLASGPPRMDTPLGDTP